MEMHEIAALLRGLALEAVGEGKGAVVASEALGEATSGMPGIVDLGADLDEGAILAALRATMAGAGAKLAAGEAFAIPVRLAGRPANRPSGSPSARLFSIGTDVDSARSLLGGSTSPKSEMGRSGSIAAARGAAPIAAPGAAPDAVPDAARIAALGAAPGSALGRDAVVAGRVALVTGGAQGFGEEITRALVASGALVWIADINVAGAARLAAELNGVAGRTAALPLGMDVTDEASVAKAFEEIALGTGALDLVVSNAGVLKAASIFDQDLGAFDFVTKVNYTGFFLVARASARMLRLQRLGAPLHGADIIQINSKSGLEGSNKNASYAGSKFGSLGLVQSFALELVEYGIKVNAICPGNFFDGPLWSDPEKGLFVQYLRTGKVKGAKTVADVKAFYEAKVPMGRGCEGPDVMRAIYYLVEQRYETGQALPVTGGQVMLN